MRLDKFLSNTGLLSRSEATKACRCGRITVNGIAVKDGSVQLDEENDRVLLDGEEIVYRKNTYIMLNKPRGYISATDDPRKKTVLELLPEHLCKIGLFPCGRLDIDTVGLLILTDDGPLAHRLISPKHHADKLYGFTTEMPFTEEMAHKMENGVTLDDGYVTLGATCRVTGEYSGALTLHEGKFHQVKRMLEAVGNRCATLERISFGGVVLDDTLERGQWRYLTETEEKILKENK